MSKHWKPAKATVRLDSPARPSRIRREPVRLNSNTPARPQRPANYRERELFFGVLGIVIFGAVIAAGVIAFSIFTAFRDDPEAAARAAEFNQCYSAQGPNCVFDGGTIYVAGSRVEIAGIDAPKIVNARCDREHDRGVAAATELAMLLNGGPVTTGAPFRDQWGRVVRKVEVKGRDVALGLIARDLVHEAGSGLSWCR